MRYIGGGTFGPADGWKFCGLADGRVLAEHPDDPLTAGGLMFGPVTVEFDSDELGKLRASHGRHQGTPDEERQRTGGFWDVWTLLPDGRISRRMPKRKAAETKP